MPFDPVLGFVVRTPDQILDSLISRYATASAGIIIDKNAEGDPVRDMLAALSLEFGALEASQAGTYASGFVGTSTGAALRNLLYPFIGEPLQPTQSTVTLPLAGVALTNVPAGSAVTLDSDGPGAAQWLLQAPVIIPGNGVFAYSSAGPKSAAAASTWSIATPVAGWASVGPNALDADLGRLAETELEYRQRYTNAVRGLLISSIAALPGVTQVGLFENPTDIPDVFWGLTHWFELLVVGGTDQAIADEIHRLRPITTQSVGNVTQAVVDPIYPGGSTSERFSRPNAIDVWVSIAITKGEGYSADTSPAAVTARENAIKDRVVTWGDARPIGLDLTATQVLAQVMTTPSVPGIADLVVFIDTVFPATAISITAGPRDQLVFDTSRISITGA